jgi:hypothetical protein
MKLVKTANGKNKIRMTRKEWTSMGKKAGWADELDYGSRPATKAIELLKSLKEDLRFGGISTSRRDSVLNRMKDNLKVLSQCNVLSEQSKFIYSECIRDPWLLSEGDIDRDISALERLIQSPPEEDQSAVSNADWSDVQ